MELTVHVMLAMRQEDLCSGCLRACSVVKAAPGLAVFVKAKVKEF